MPIPVIAIFDIGKTNKKFFLLNDRYDVQWEQSSQLEETTDPDGFPCDDVEALSRWMVNMLSEALDLSDFEIVALNFSGYGASWVHLGHDGKPVTPLYNYLKPFPTELRHQFYSRYGGESQLTTETASPVLGNLNSGLQLYWLKHQRPDVFRKIRFSLHLPQYLSYLFTQNPVSELTSIGCHTHLWDFGRHGYHSWVQQENLIDKFPPIVSSTSTSQIAFRGKQLTVGVGLHDSSAALIPYLTSVKDSFVLISTGTWSISLNPFNSSPLTMEELRQDCLCYLSYQGRPIKASRLFAGHEHEEVAKQLATHFNKPIDYYKIISTPPSAPLSRWTKVADFNNYESAYQSFIEHLVEQQVNATQRVLRNSDVNCIFVDGGFSKNPLFMKNLTRAFDGKDVYTTHLHQASAVGAALAIHQAWNPKPIAASVLSLIKVAP